MKMRELCNEWIKKEIKYRVKPQTYLRYCCAINEHIIPFIGELNVTKIDKRTILDYINDLREYRSLRTHTKLANSTLNLSILVLRMIFNYAVDYDIINESPMVKVKSLERVKVNKAKFFNIDEQIRIEKSVKTKDRSYLGILLDLYTGLRIGELLALTWDDVDYENNVIHVNKTVYIIKNENGLWEQTVGTPKTKTSYRDIPISDYVKTILDDLYDPRSVNVISTNEAISVNSKEYRYQYNQLLKELNIRHLSFHALRHTFATRAIESGMDVKSLSEILGHADAAMTLNIYAHSTIEHKRLMMDKMHPFYDQV